MSKIFRFLSRSRTKCFQINNTKKLNLCITENIENVFSQIQFSISVLKTRRNFKLNFETFSSSFLFSMQLNSYKILNPSSTNKLFKILAIYNFNLLFPDIYQNHLLSKKLRNPPCQGLPWFPLPGYPSCEFQIQGGEIRGIQPYPAQGFYFLITCLIHL